MKKYLVFIMLLVSTLFIGCEEETDPIIDGPIIKSKITGTVQKGPFVLGSKLVIHELRSDLTATWTHTEDINIDQKSNFVVPPIQLISPYVAYTVSGYYFNEVKNEISDSIITLEGIADISSNSILNVNILTHLEKPRVEYLVENANKTFSEAKKQAQNEILYIFGIQKGDILNSELLDITRNTEDDKTLLLITAICQGYRNTSELQSLLSDIRNDLEEDGDLDSQQIGNELRSHAKYLNAENIRLNLQTKYNQLGVTANVSTFDLESTIKYFENVMKFTFTPLITYDTNDNTNILNPNVSSYNINVTNKILIDLPENRYLSIRISKIEYTGVKWFVLNLSDFWNFTYDYDNEILNLTATPGESNYVLFVFESTNSGQYLVEYFEMLSTTPNESKTRTIIVQ